MSLPKVLSHLASCINIKAVTWLSGMCDLQVGNNVLFSIKINKLSSSYYTSLKVLHLVVLCAKTNMLMRVIKHSLIKQNQKKVT